MTYLSTETVTYPQCLPITSITKHLWWLLHNTVCTLSN